MQILTSRLASALFTGFLACSSSPLLAQVQISSIKPPGGGQTYTFGFGLAVDGNRAAVGSYGGHGRAWVFERQGLDWSLDGELATGRDQLEYYGYSVDIEGDLAVVGSPTITPSMPGESSVFLYRRGPQGWELEQELANPGPTGGNFGFAVSLHGNCLAATATRWSSSGSSQGRVLLYEFDPGLQSWELEGMVAMPNTEEFGWDVDLEQDRFAVSAHKPGIGNSGRAFVFHRTVLGWELEAELVPDESVQSGWYGYSIDLNGDRVLVGASRRDNSAGGAYLFEHGAQGWTQSAPALHAPGLHNDLLGTDVVLGQGTAWLGAPQAGEQLLDSGTVVAFHQASDGTWAASGQLRANPPQAFREAGRSLALEGDRLFVASPGFFITGGIEVAEWQVPAFARPFGTCSGAVSPCLNGDELAGCANSTQTGAALRAAGSASMQADDLVLLATDLPPDTFGLVFAGSVVVSLSFGDGLRVVGPGSTGLFRFPIRQANGAGTFQEGPGLAAASEDFGPAGTWQPGSTWFVQAWYRDPLGPCGTGFNLSQGLELTLNP